MPGEGGLRPTVNGEGTLSRPGEKEKRRVKEG